MYCQQCGGKVDEKNAKFCRRCGNQLEVDEKKENSKKATSTKLAEVSNQSKKSESIGGWLIPVCLGLIYRPFALAIGLFGTYLPIVTDGSWEQLTTPGMDAYHPLWAPALMYEIIGNFIFLLAGCYLLFLFFKRSRTFPKTFVVVMGASLVFLVVDLFLANSIPAVASQDNSDLHKQIMQTIIACAIWIPYMFKSVRVKNTFIEEINDPIYPFISSITAHFGKETHKD